MRITVHIPDEVRSDLKRAASSEDVSVSALVATAIRTYLALRQRRRAVESILEIADGQGVAPGALRALSALRRAGGRS
jgi:predicted transcriptional regulator